MKRFLNLFGLAALFFAGCNQAETASSEAAPVVAAFNLAAAKESVAAVNIDFDKFIAAGDSVAISNLYASDAVLLPANMPVFMGKEAIAAFFGEGIRGGFKGLKLQTTELFGNEELLSEVGTYILSDARGGQIDNGKYIVLWKKEDGKWKLFRDIFNSDNPPPPPPPVKK